MGRRFKVAGSADQGFLMPPDPREWLPPGHLAWALLELAGELDLSGFEGRYRPDGKGRPAYHPALMVVLVMYCYCKGIRSSRGIEMATFDDVGARVICGNLHPDHATIARFAVLNEAALKRLLAQSVAACARRGLVSVELVAGDGTKMKASASMTANVTAADLDAEIAALQELIEAQTAAWVAEHLAADTAGQDRGRPGPPAGQAGGQGRKRTVQTLARRQAARSKLGAEVTARAGKDQARRDSKVQRLAERAAVKREEAGRLLAAAGRKAADWQERAAACPPGRLPSGRKPADPDQNRDVRRVRAAAARLEKQAAAAAAAPGAPGRDLKVNLTDPASRIMPLKKGGYDQLFNIQALAVRRQVIIAIGRHDSPDDTGALHPLLAAARAVLNAAGITAPIGKALWDAGYASDSNFTAPGEAELYVAVARESRQTRRLRDGHQPATMKPSWQQMAARLDTPAGRALYKQRAAIIEPVFAQLFARLGRHLNYRGDRTDLELHLFAASHNLLKAIRASQHPPAPATA
jgi:transposase